MNRTQLKILYNNAKESNHIRLSNVNREREFFDYIIENTPWIKRDSNQLQSILLKNRTIEELPNNGLRIGSTDPLVKNIDFDSHGRIISGGVINRDAVGTNILQADGTTKSIHELLESGSNISIVPTVDGKVKVSVVDIDTTLYRLVNTLPTTDIDSDKMYIIPKDNLTQEQLENIGGANSIKESDRYVELIYVSDGINSHWETLGGTGVDIDLDDYYTKNDSDNRFIPLSGNRSLKNGHLTITWDSIVNKSISINSDGGIPQIELKTSSADKHQIRVENDLLSFRKNGILDFINTSGVKIGTGAIDNILHGDGTTTPKTDYITKGISTYKYINFPDDIKITTSPNTIAFDVGTGVSSFKISSTKTESFVNVHAPKFIKDDGTATQILLGDGSTKPTTDFANKTHNHTTEQVLGLNAELAGKAPIAGVAESWKIGAYEIKYNSVDNSLDFGLAI